MSSWRTNRRTRKAFPLRIHNPPDAEYWIGYHGTRPKNVEAILKEGLTPGIDTREDALLEEDPRKFVFLTTDLNEAKDYGEVLEVRVPKELIEVEPGHGGAADWLLVTEPVPPENIRRTGIKANYDPEEMERLESGFYDTPSAGTVMTVPLEEIEYGDNRNTTAVDKREKFIHEYMEMLKNGESLGIPVVQITDDGVLKSVEGWHRIQAMRRIGMKEGPVKVENISEKELE
jgi:hypothetical protein